MINFILVAFVLFLIIRAANRAKEAAAKEEAAEEEPTTKVCPYCQGEIPIKAVKCMHCGSDLPEEEAAE